MGKRLFLFSIFLFVGIGFSQAAAPTRSDTYVSGTTIEPAAVTRNEDAIFGYLQAGVDTLANNSVTSANIVDATIVNADVSVTAAVAGSKISPTFTSPVVVEGATPSVTIGDGGAEDSQVNFDGAAQDFHVGLDDTDDDLKIGLGTALGTTTHMAFTEDGEVTKPLQPTFNVAGADTDLGEGSTSTLNFDTETFDIGSNFASDTFTAPVTGKYLLGFEIVLNDIDSAATFYRMNIITSNREYEGATFDPSKFSADLTRWPASYSVVADMDASDTATIQWFQSGGAAQTDKNASSFFYGALLN